MSRPSGRVVTLGTIGAVGRRPDLWLTAARQAWRLLPRRRSVRGNSYVDFRMHTQYGTDTAQVTGRRRADDVVAYLGWCREWNAMLRRERTTSVARSAVQHRPSAPTKRTDSVPVAASHDGNGN